VVFVFAKAPTDALAGLVKEIDKLVADNADEKLAAVINFTGDSTDEYLAQISEFAEEHNITNVHLAVTGDADNQRISDEAEVTVMHYLGKTVKFNYSVKSGELNKDAIDAIIKGADTIIDSQS
jgi:hypothetical protein